MPLRNRIKEGFKQAGHDLKGLFKTESGDSVKASARPTIPSSTYLHTTGVAVAEDVDTNGSSGSQTLLPTRVPRPTSPPVEHMTQKPVGTMTDKKLRALGSGLMASAVDSLKFGPIKDISDMLQGWADMYIMEGAVKKEYQAMEQRLQRLLKLLGGHTDENKSPEWESKVQEIRDFIQGELNSIGLKQMRTSSRRLAMAKEEEDQFLVCCQRIQGYMDQLLVDTTRSTWKTEERLLKDRMSSLVGRLPFSGSACYNSSVGAELKRRGCTPGTRIDVLATLLAWARNKSSSGVYWLNGMAGTGKTTIAYSVSKDLDAGLNLAASFFCSRLREECRDVNMIIPSIAHQLARLSFPFQSALCSAIEGDPDMHIRRLDLQFKALIEEPLLSIKQNLPEGLVVVIDALDECDNKESTTDILKFLLTHAANLPIKFIISSRPEPQIRDHMAKNQVNSRLVLHELDTGNVQADIKTYLEDELKSMKPPPTDAQVRSLAERAGILFIYAATAVRYIGYDNFHRNPAARLRTILDGSQGRKSAENKVIDHLYTTILNTAFEDEELEEGDRADMKQVLHTVICAREPLTIDALSELLQINEPARVQAALRPLWSVLHVVTGSELVTTLHASFPDYLLDVSRSKKHHCDSNTQNREIAERCFERIQETHPQLNILGLESSYLRDQDVKNIIERVPSKLPMDLLYACRYWADHVKAGDWALSVIEKLRNFLSMRLLLCIEVLNLSKQMTIGMKCMKMAVDWCKAFKVEQELIELALDAKRFLDAFASNPVSQSTPHIYVSMLAFWPRSSPIGRHYAKYTQGPVKPEGTALALRQPSHLSTWAFEKGVRTMAVSPDGLSLALGIEEKVVVVDSSSGRKLLEPLNGTGNALSIVFSADGTSVYAGFTYGKDATILRWDTSSGETVLGPFQLHGHTGDINCLNFSSDRTRIVTSCEGSTVRVWDTENGQMLHTLYAYTQLKRHVKSAVFSPDSARIILFLYDAVNLNTACHFWDTQAEYTIPDPFITVIRANHAIFSSDGSRIISYGPHEISVWDAQGGEEILGPIEGHTGAILHIGCSPDGRYIVSGSADRTVCVWDAQNGNLVLGPLQAHTGWLTSVAFTPDGSRIISTCDDGLVCTWNAQLHSLADGSTSPPFHRITCVKFSSDGTRFVSGSEEGTISVWDAQTGEMRVGPIEAHTSPVWAVDFRNDRVVSCDTGGIIHVCDAMSGEIVLGPLRLGLGWIRAIAYSLNGQMIVTGCNESVDVWNAQNGKRVVGPLTALNGRILSVQFSSDGTRIVASSEGSGSNIAVWDVSTGQTVFGALDGHVDLVSALAYSPDGALIASSSLDQTMIVWDAYTGKKRLGPLSGHSWAVFSIHFSPDSTRLVSGSLDRTIQVWDVQTGDMVFQLLSGHEDAIRSVEYSPDGTCILSRSNDMSVRIHDARSPAERAMSRSEFEVGDWTIDKDGWVVDDQSRLLVWVPGDLRKALMWSETRVMVAPQGYVRLKFDKSRMGESWMASYTSEV